MTSTSAYSPLTFRGFTNRVVSENAELQRLTERSQAAKRKASQPNVGLNVEAFLDHQLEFFEGEENIYAEAREIYRELYRNREDDKFSRKDLLDCLKAHESKRALLQRQLGALTHKRRKISDHLRSVEESELDRAFAQALSSAMGAPAGATLFLSGPRSRPQQKTWQTEVRNYLQSVCPDPAQGNHVWCPITRGYHPGSLVKTAHIIPRSMPGKLVLGAIGRKDVLEDGEDIIWSPENGIPMVSAIEEAYDQARFVIVPFSNGDQIRYKAVVLDSTLFGVENDLGVSNGEHKSWKDIHNKELDFKHPTNRPGHRNLFFHCVTTLCRREFFEPPGWYKDIDKFDNLELLWQLPEPYFRQSTLRHLVNVVGRTDREGPLSVSWERWLAQNTFDEPIRLSPDDDPEDAAKTIAREIFHHGLPTEMDEEEDDSS